MAVKTPQLNNAPVIHVLIQVVVDDYLKIGTRIPDLQESLRHLGFFEFEQLMSQHYNLNPETGELSVNLANLWRFFSIDRSTRLSVNQNSIILEQANHTHFGGLKEELLRILQETGKIWPEGHKNRRRLGLRYVNLLKPTQQHPEPVDFLSGGFRGVSLTGKTMKKNFRKVESFIEFAYGLVAIRYADIPGQPIFPVGIDPTGMRHKIPKLDNSFGLLDIDCFNQIEKQYNLEELSIELEQFHEHVHSAFLSSCTESALKEWRLYNAK